MEEENEAGEAWVKEEVRRVRKYEENRGKEKGNTTRKEEKKKRGKRKKMME